MELIKIEDPLTRTKQYILTITDADIAGANARLIARSGMELHHFSRDGASIEERLMGLQIIARAVEEGRNGRSA